MTASEILIWVVGICAGISFLSMVYFLIFFDPGPDVVYPDWVEEEFRENHKDDEDDDDLDPVIVAAATAVVISTIL